MSQDSSLNLVSLLIKINPKWIKDLNVTHKTTEGKHISSLALKRTPLEQ